MEIPKFRRKPKKPTIATDTQSLNPPEKDTTDSEPASPNVLKPSTQKQGLRKSAFRSLHLRSAVKRARSPATAPTAVQRPSSSHLPSSAVADDDYHNNLNVPLKSSPVSVRHRDGQAVGERNKEDLTSPTPRVPAFLEQSQDDITSKFSDLQWTEQTRLSSAQAREAYADPDSTYPYAFYQQSDFACGSMDRYSNIKPFRNGRVRLQVPDSTLDYVNASPICLNSPAGKLPPLKYIAMQGPTASSVDFVWRMVAEQMESPVVMVQLTTMREQNAEKCFPYLPLELADDTLELNDQDAWDDGWRAQLKLESLDTLENGAIELRKLGLSVLPPKPAEEDMGETSEDDDGGVAAAQDEEPLFTKVVWHFLYTKWPDFGAPAAENLQSFLTLMKLSREYATGERPSATTASGDNSGTHGSSLTTTEKLQREVPARIVHCSAGVGRTGTFITLEHLMRELDTGALDEFDTDASRATTPSPSDSQSSLSASRPSTSTNGSSRKKGAHKKVPESQDPVLQTVEALREQRTLMVQAPPQFLFLYQTLRAMWLDRHQPAGGSDGGRSDGERAAKRLEVDDSTDYTYSD